MIFWLISLTFNFTGHLKCAKMSPKIFLILFWHLLFQLPEGNWSWLLESPQFLTLLLFLLVLLLQLLNLSFHCSLTVSFRLADRRKSINFKCVCLQKLKYQISQKKFTHHHVEYFATFWALYWLKLGHSFNFSST